MRTYARWHSLSAKTFKLYIKLRESISPPPVMFLCLKVAIESLFVSLDNVIDLSDR